jgi:hypothetical protein
VVVGAAEAEGAHAGAAARGGPGPRGLVQDEGARVALPVGVRVFHVQGGGQHAAVDRERGLDEARQARRALGVADLRLHRAQGARRGLGAGRDEGLGERGQLGLVADDGAGAVSLDQPDLDGREPGARVGAVDGALLAVLARRGEAEVAPVAGRAHARQHGVDAVAVALGVGEALEHHHRGALAQRDAVGVGVEGAAAPLARQRVDAGEHQVVVDAVVEVGAATEHHVGGAGQQLLDGEVHRGQRRGARGVDRVVGAAEVEAVGDPAGDDVGEHAGEGVLGQARQMLVERGGQLAGELGKTARKP